MTSTQVLKSLLTLAKYNNGEWKTEKQKIFLLKQLKENGNRFFSNEVMYSSIYFIFEYNQNGLTKITKEIQGRHRRYSQIKLTFGDYWLKLDQKENIINNIKLRDQQIKKLKRNLCLKNINKYKEIIMCLYKKIFMEELNQQVLKQETRQELIDIVNAYRYDDTSYFIKEGLKTDPDHIALKRLQKLVEKVEEKNKKIESLF